MTSRLSAHPYSVEVWWPYRAAIAPMSVEFRSAVTRGCSTRIALDYTPLLHIAGEAVSAISWTRIRMDSALPFAKNCTEFRCWLRTQSGRRQLTDTTLTYQNIFIDHLKAEFPYNQNIAHIRYYGAAEWPYISVSCGKEVLWERATPGLRSQIASTPLEPQLASLSEGPDLSTPARVVARAATLVECGYPTEGLLTAVAVLDTISQDTLVAGMVGLGLGEEVAVGQLRNVTQQRLETYLDSLLKIVGGHSLREDDPSLFAKVREINRARNDAIHRGQEVARSFAQEAVQAIHDVLEFLNRVTTNRIDAGPRPRFSPD